MLWPLSAQSPFQTAIWGVCAGLVFVSRCIRPEGPWQRLAAALVDSSAFLTPFYMTGSCPQPLWVILGNPFLPQYRLLCGVCVCNLAQRAMAAAGFT